MTKMKTPYGQIINVEDDQVKNMIRLGWKLAYPPKKDNK